MSTPSIKNPLAPRNWLRMLTAGLAATAAAAGRTLKSAADGAGDVYGAGPALRPATNLQVVQRPGLPPALGHGTAVVPLKGFNIYSPHAQRCGIPDEDFDAAIDTLVDESDANAVRMWGFEAMVPAGDWSSLDHAVAKAEDRGLSLTVVLGNQWGDCEPPINATTGLRFFKNVDWYRSGYKSTYRAYVQSVAQRYASSPAVSLQLMNEALPGTLIHPEYDDQDWQCQNETDSAQVLQSFTRDMVSLVRAAAPNLLVSLGTRGQSKECGTQGSNYGAIATLVDLCEIHSYDVPYSLAADRMQQCFAAGKPIIMGESASGMPQSARTQQAQAYYAASAQGDLESQANTLVQRMQVLAGGGLAGTHIWWYQTNASTADQYAISADHPIHPMLQKLTAASLTATAASVSDFPATLASLRPPPPAPLAPPVPAAPSLPPAPPLTPMQISANAPPLSPRSGAYPLAWEVDADFTYGNLNVHLKCPGASGQDQLSRWDFTSLVPALPSAYASGKPNFAAQQPTIKDGWLVFPIQVTKNDRPDLSAFSTTLSSMPC